MASSAMVAGISARMGSLSLGGSIDSLRGTRVASSRAAPSSDAPGRRPTIRCARVAGVEIPNNKRIETSLTYIYGIGTTTSRVILADLGFENKHARDLSEEELTSLRAEVEKYMIEGDLRRFNSLAIKRLKDIGCYRGRRHQAGLPCRGQKTKCNARTRKGKKVAIAGKKKK